MKRDMTTATFAKGRTRKPATPKTLLDYDMQRAHALGYGCHYGDYKTDHPNTRAEFEQLTEKAQREDPNLTLTTCAHCGKKFVKRSYQTNKKFCSETCQAQHQYEKKRKQIEMQKHANPGRTAVCPICGAEFVTNNQHRIYCSTECYAAGQRKRNEQRKEQRKKEATTNGSI